MRPGVRIGDHHVCPSCDPSPHLGGLVAKSGCSAVIIEGMVSARGGDTALCAVATDVIMKGSGTVLIGGMPAARLAEPCLHGGVVTSGASEVFIGGPTVAPAGIDQIVRNVQEIDRLNAGLREGAERKKLLDDYLRGPPPLSPAEKEALKVLKKMAPKQPKDLGPGADDFSNEEARTADAASAERDSLNKKMERDRDRIEQLELENQELQKGKSVLPPAGPEASAKR